MPTVLCATRPRCAASGDVVHDELTVVVSATPADYEYISDLLWGLGVAAVSEDWSTDGEVTLRTSLGDDADVARDAMESVGVDFRLEWVDSSVGETWRTFSKPIVVGDSLVVAPSWCDEADVLEVRDSICQPGVVCDQVRVVSIEPGSTFGMGDHPTTASCLLMIERYLGPGMNVLDVGCGSGILGIVALVLGAAHAHGVDINPASIAVSNANAQSNGVADRWSVSTDALTAISRPFELVVANILAPTLVGLAVDLRRLTADTGVLVISGVLDGHYDHVADALSPLREIEKIECGGWVAVAFGR